MHNLAMSIITGSQETEISTTYTQYNGTYFPYKLEVTYYPGNATTSNLGLPSSWTVTNYNQGHNAVVKTISEEIASGVARQNSIVKLCWWSSYTVINSS